MKKGFTLIELIMVIVVLALLAIIAVPSINLIIKNSREKTYSEQIDRIETAAKSYMADSKRSLSLPSTVKDKTNSCYVGIKTLKKVGLLENKDIKDPRKGKDSISGYIIISNTNGKFNYEYTETIDDSIPLCYDEGDIDEDTTISVIYNCSANGGVCPNGKEQEIKQVKLSHILKEAPDSPSKENYEFEGWNTDKNAREKLRNITAKDIKDSSNSITLYALYKKDVSIKFHYYDNTSKSIATATSKCYIFSDNDTNCSFSIPSKVSESKTIYGSSFVGLATETGSMLKADISNLVIENDYYAIYSKEVTYYYYKDNAYIKGILYRNEFINNDQISTVISDLESGTSNTDFSNSVGPCGSIFVGVSKKANTSNIITETDKIALSDVSTIYTVYRFNVLFKKGINVDSVGSDKDICDVTYERTSCTVVAPSVTPSYGYTFKGWSNDYNGLGETKDEKLSVEANNQIYYAIATDQTSPNIESFSANNITTKSVTLSVKATAASGIAKYEFSIDGGKTWIDNGTNNTYTFDKLTVFTKYSFKVKVTSNANLSSTKDVTATTKAITKPTLLEDCNSGKVLKVKITYPSGCGSDFTCSYIINNDENPVVINSKSENVTVNDDDTLTADIKYTANDSLTVNITAIVSDGINKAETEESYYKMTNISDIVKANTINTNNNDYRYQGSNVNNYVTFNNEQWRIIGIVDGKAKLVKNTYLNDITWWDKSAKSKWGESSLYNSLNGDYYNSLSDDAKEMIFESTWYLGSLDNNAKSEDFYNLERGINLESDVNTINANIGLMYPSDYVYGASDGTYNSSNNWLYSNVGEWLITSHSTKIYAYYINNSGTISSKYVSNTSYVRPSVYLNSNVYINGGDGTVNNPYTLDTKDKAVCGTPVGKPSFKEETCGEVEITYPSGCGDTLTCSYKKDNEEKVIVNGETVTVSFNANGTLIATVTANDEEENTESSTYTVVTNVYDNLKTEINTGGLKKDTTESGRYVYRGTSPNNYIKLGDDLYRIIAVESDGTLKVIKNEALKDENGKKIEIPFDYGYDTYESPVEETETRYSKSTDDYCYALSYKEFVAGVEKDGYAGCNVWGSNSTTFESDGKTKTETMSRIIGGKKYKLPDKEATVNTYLNKTWYNSLSADVKKLITTHMFNVGVVKASSGQNLDTDISQESAYKWSGHIGLISVIDYVKSNSDIDACGTVYANSGNEGSNFNCHKTTWIYNDIAKGEEGGWYPKTITPLLDDNKYYIDENIDGTPFHLWVITSAQSDEKGNHIDDYLGGHRASTTSSDIIPVFYLTSDIYISSGNGTKDNPYTVGKTNIEICNKPEPINSPAFNTVKEDNKIKVTIDFGVDCSDYQCSYSKDGEEFIPVTDTSKPTVSFTSSGNVVAQVSKGTVIVNSSYTVSDTVFD